METNSRANLMVSFLFLLKVISLSLLYLFDSKYYIFSLRISIRRHFVCLCRTISRFYNCIVGVGVIELASSAVDRGFEPRSGQTKDYKIGICCFSAKHAALRRKSKDWLSQNQDNVSEWSDMSISGLLFQ